MDEGSEHSLTEIARLAELPISTAHRLTTELTSWRLLERTSDGLYRAGPPLRMISNGPDRSPTLPERAPCVLGRPRRLHPQPRPPGCLARSGSCLHRASTDRFRRALTVTRLTHVAVTRYELEAGACGVAMPVFGRGGEVLAAIELTVRSLGTTLQPVVVALSIATRSLSRELAGQPRQVRTDEPMRLPDRLLVVAAGS